MTEREKIQLVDEISAHLQEHSSTTEINTLLKRYKFPFEKRKVASNKKLYVTEALTGQSEDVLTKIAVKLKLRMAAPKVNKTAPKRQPVSNAKSAGKSLASNKSSEKKVFISHASLDKDIVGKIIDLLKAMGVNGANIFCSSFEGYGISLGEDFLDRLKNELNKNVLVLFVLSKNFYDSPVCLCEMGAAWVTTKEHIPILIPPFGFKDVKGVFPNTQGMILNDKNKINSLKEAMEKFFGLTPIKHSIWEQDRTEILEEIDRRLKNRGYYHY